MICAPSIRPVWSKSSLSAWRTLTYPLSAWRRLWSDRADAQADLSLRWAHRLFCWFCHAAAHLHFWHLHRLLYTYINNDCCRAKRVLKGLKCSDVSSPELKAHWWAYRIGRRPHSLNISSETTGPIKVKFHIELLWDGGTKICANGLGHMTKLAAMPIYGKILKNLLLRNQKADDLETWYAASGAQVLPRVLT